MNGILTFHRASNYGAVLQAYALNTFLNNTGHETEIIDYYCREVEEAHVPIYVFKRSGVLGGIKSYYNKSKKYNEFQRFRDRRMHLDGRYDRSDIAAADEKYDHYIVGSDQVWSPEFAGKDKTFLLDFTEDRKKYSYAASFGNMENRQADLPYYIEYLKKFRVVSVRESSAAAMLEEQGIRCRVDVDPTFLLDHSEWSLFAKKPQEDKYILIYTVQPPRTLLDYGRRLAGETGCKLIYLNNEHKANKDITHVRFSSPEEFVGWFANAEYVLTNSFHGTAFSIINKRKFKVEIETRKKRNTRSEDLVKSCGLEESILNEGMSSTDFDYNWETTGRKLEEIIQRSKNYLCSIGRE